MYVCCSAIVLYHHHHITSHHGCLVLRPSVFEAEWRYYIQLDEKHRITFIHYLIAVCSTGRILASTLPRSSCSSRGIWGGLFSRSYRFNFNLYHSRMRLGNTFGRVVCLSCLDSNFWRLWPRNLIFVVCGHAFRISWSRSSIEVIELRSRSSMLIKFTHAGDLKGNVVCLVFSFVINAVK